MPTENTNETRRPSKFQNPGAPPQEQEHLPCPRCDSTNTKFCYYNNYNFSQPRHFCKSCRRYWTHGGTLRDIPVGGGIRKNAKRSRSIASTSPSTVLSHPLHDQALPATATPFFVSLSGIPPAAMQLDAAVSSSSNGIAKQNLNMYGSLTSLLNNTSQYPGFGLDMGPTVEDVSFEMGRGVWPFQRVVDGSVHLVGQVRSTGIGNAWQFENGEGRFVSGDCYS